MNNTKIFKMSFASVYPLYIKKVERKGRTAAEVDEIIFWLTGYDQQQFQQHLDNKTDFETFFADAPQMNPNVSKITGLICGYRVEEIEDKLMQKIRYLDKLIDELAKGKKNGEDIEKVEIDKPVMGNFIAMVREAFRAQAKTTKKRIAAMAAAIPY